MGLNRRTFLTGKTAAAAVAAAPLALADWQPSQRYPDPAVRVLDPSFARYRLDLAKVERLGQASGGAKGPVWFGDGRYLLWSDIPNNRIMKWDEETGAISVFRKPSNNSNGNTRDRQGRLVTCEHDTRRVTRTEYDGTITVDRRPVRRQAPELAERRRVPVRRLDLVLRPAVRHPRLLRGPPATPELPTNVYRVDPANGRRGRRRRRRQAAERPRVFARTSRSSTSSRAAPRSASSAPTTSWTAARSSRTSGRSSTPATARPTVCASTWTATCGRAGAWARRARTASGVRSRGQARSAASICPSAAPTSASAALPQPPLHVRPTSLYSLFVGTQGAAGG